MPRDDMPSDAVSHSRGTRVWRCGRRRRHPAAVSDAVGVRAAPDRAGRPSAAAGIGAQAPDFQLPGIDGKTYSLASFSDAQGARRDLHGGALPDRRDLRRQFIA